MVSSCAIVALLISGAADALKPAAAPAIDRRQLLSGGVAAAGAACLPQAASARGRATQGANYLRYAPRIEKLGAYLTGDAPSSITSANWAKVGDDAAAELGKKGGKIGVLFDGELAMNLWADTYSDTKETEKTKLMKAEVESIAAAREKLANVGCQGVGTCLKKEGGFLGFGAKEAPRPSNQALANEGAAAVVAAKTAYNKFVALNNQNLPFDLNPMKTI